MVDVHCFSLDVDTHRLRELEDLLSSEERDRAARFRFDRDRNCFIVCRGTLREMLGIRPRQEFSYGDFGKPELPGSDIRFNVSHSDRMAMIVVTRGREVGCDIERIDPSFADENIPESFFSQYEVEMLRALPEQDQTDAFFRCWTRKEAYIKACGMGMSLALDSFDVTLAPDQPAALLRGADGWSLHSVRAQKGYAASIVLEERRNRSVNVPIENRIAPDLASEVQPALTRPTNSLI